jgi:hypothetical protein
MTAPFFNYKQPGEVSIAMAQTLIGEHLWDGAKVNAKFMEGDHWQEGVGWIGPMPNATEEGYAATKALIEKGFISKNAIKEVVDRHVNGLLGLPPEWGFTPIKALKENEEISPADQALIDEAEAAVTQWWDKRDAHNLIKDVATKALWAGRGLSRVYVPSGLLVDVVVAAPDGQATTIRGVAVPNGDVNKALELIWIESPKPDVSTVYEVFETKEEIGMVITAPSATSTVNTTLSTQQLELTYLEKQAIADKVMTVLALKRLEQQAESIVKMDLGGRITMFEMKREPLITEQVQSMQRAINLAISVVPRTIVTGGFLERIILNGQMPGEWVEDAKTKEKRFVPGKLSMGAGTTNFISGVEHEDQSTGTTKLADPEVVIREPTDPSFAVKGERALYRDLLEEVDQVHILMSADAVASGVAREQARVDFMLSLNKTRPQVEVMGRWMLETVLAMAEVFAGTPGKYTSKLKAYFRCKPDFGPISSDERNQTVQEVEKGMKSRERGMNELGVDDVDAELAKINSQPDAQVDLVKRQGEALKALVDATVPLEIAMELVGFDPEVVQKAAAKAEEAKQKELDAQVEMAEAQGAIDTDKAVATAKAKPAVPPPAM